jgi:hypothetical protein
MDLVVMAAGTTDYTDFTERIGSIMKDTTCTCPIGAHEGATYSKSVSSVKSVVSIFLYSTRTRAALGCGRQSKFST